VPSPATRLTHLPPYAFAVISQRVNDMLAAGQDVIRLDIGSPDMPPPDHVIEALEESARHPGHHGYSGYKGTSSFRRAVAEYYQQRFGVSVNPDTEVLPLMGSKEGIVNLALAYIDKGDLALVPDIGYPAYSMGALLAGGDVHWLPIKQENDYLLDLSDLPDDVLRRAKLLWLNYPNNPTGATAEIDFYERMVEFCMRHDILLVSDNPYVDVTYDGYIAGSALQAAGAKNCTVEFMSCSKTYNMGGWRLGAAVGAALALKTLLHAKSNMDSGHFVPIYDAGVAALTHTSRAWIDRRNAIYQARRDRMVAALPYMGLEGYKTSGSLYVWARVLDGDSTKYVEDALTQARVSLAPGGMYGPGGDPYVRFSLGMTDERIDESLERLKTWYAAR